MLCSEESSLHAIEVRQHLGDFAPLPTNLMGTRLGDGKAVQEGRSGFFSWQLRRKHRFFCRNTRSGASLLWLPPLPHWPVAPAIGQKQTHAFEPSV